MTSHEAAYQRKNLVLSDPSGRLNTLIKNGAEEELKHPHEFGKEGPTKPAHCRFAGAENCHVLCTRLCGLAQLALFLAAFVVGAFVCFVRHEEDVSSNAPGFFVFFLHKLKLLGLHHLVSFLFGLWEGLPEKTQKSVTKTLTYGTIGATIYPVLVSKPKAQPKDGEEQQPEEPVVDSHADLMKALSAYARVASSVILCGLLGYDASRNFKLLFHVFPKFA
ncbi:uncharacterized protein BEWA_006350 [Theileria equi strain WA]|uniref:Membrane protein, putative n=1 Tax=Theileria equi strain WA TaxID=1537102 RepID=L0B1V1_THEEQ|nr:uncharacterized protein BEWA_006350 [Theileria equi strain WA]AFZ81226.1 membrane protein, putative [Theileria equi strain WA]|eukprot:XP_004830892.1 uncharacterized protein BEWA_006350 [Theileria equi strain WA]